MGCLLRILFYPVGTFRPMMPACNLGFDPFTDRCLSLDPVVCAHSVVLVYSLRGVPCCSQVGSQNQPCLKSHAACWLRVFVFL